MVTAAAAAAMKMTEIRPDLRTIYTMAVVMALITRLVVAVVAIVAVVVVAAAVMTIKIRMEEVVVAVITMKTSIYHEDENDDDAVSCHADRRR